MNHRSFDETIMHLLNVASNPKTFLESFAYFLNDLRDDVKSISHLLQQFQHMLKEVEK